MLDYEIKKEGDGSWVVVARKEVETRLFKADPGQCVFQLPGSGDDSVDMKTCINLLAHTFRIAEASSDSVGDRVLSYLYSPKYIPISMFTSSTTRSPKVANLFADIKPNAHIKELGLNAVMTVDPAYADHVTGAYLSTVPSLENLSALRDKMCKTGTVYDANLAHFKAVFGFLLCDFKAHSWQMDASVDPDVPYFLNYNPNSGVGFKHWELHYSRTKRDMAPYARRVVKKFLRLVKDNIGSGEDLLPPQVYTYTTKAEIRSVEEAPGKVRLISMVGLVWDFVSKLCTLPFMRGLEKWYGCLIGTSVWSTFTYTLLRGAREPEFMNLEEHMRGESFVPDDPTKFMWVIADISAHDMSYSPVGLFGYLLFRLFYVTYADKYDEDIFKEMFSVEMGGVNSKVVQWFGGYTYMVLGLMASGWLGTSHIASLMTIFSTYLVLLDVFGKEIGAIATLKEPKLFVYGDDFALKLPKYFYDKVDGATQKIIESFKKHGLTIKPSAFSVFQPMKRHKNRLFTHIRHDEIISPGVNILQRYLVKYNDRHQAMHPDAKDYAYIMPWRNTSSYATRFAMDAHNFLGKEGRNDTRRFDPYVMAYIKNYSLLLDAGPNRKAHNLIKEMMRNIEAYKPGTAKAAYYADRGVFDEIGKKLGPKSDLCFPYITQCVFLPDKKTYAWVVSHIVVDSEARFLKKPEYKFRSVAAVHGDLRIGKPYWRDGHIIYI